jgi:hypothetical protein
VNLRHEGVGRKGDGAPYGAPDADLVGERERLSLVLLRADDSELTRDVAPFWGTSSGTGRGRRGAGLSWWCRDEARFSQLYPDGTNDAEEEEIKQREEDVLEEPLGRTGHLS